MANPFPGMDPYLEGWLWQSVHANLATEVTRYLVPRLCPKYVALTTERGVLADIDDGDDELIPQPDVCVLAEQPRGAGGTAAENLPLLARAIELEAVPQFAVEIRDARDRRLVTAIEILSHTDKQGTGRIEYAGKRRELLA